MMDFFATGGYQQLLSDLHDVEQPQSINKDYNNNNNNNSSSSLLTLQYNDYECMLNGEQQFNDCCYYGAYQSNDDDDDHHQHSGIRTSAAATLLTAAVITATTATTIATNGDDLSNGSRGDFHDYDYDCDYDYNNNNKSKSDGNDGSLYDIGNCDAQLQQSLDLLLSSCSNDITDDDAIGDEADMVNGTERLDDGALSEREDEDMAVLLDLDLNGANFGDGTHITGEMSDWEDKFLDNYIEIPELIDILPEKTPLCNEMCELFLHESSKQLQLSRCNTTSSSDSGSNGRSRRHPKQATAPPTRATTKSTTSATSNARQPLKATKQRQRSTAAAIAAAAAITADGEENEEDAISALPIGPVNGYPCTYGSCQNVYAKPAHLKAHLRRHMGEKPYVCNWPNCTWKFSRSDELARHRRSHSGVKPYKCVYCAKCFARSDHLTKHRKVHERRMLAASRDGGAIDGILPASVFTVRPGRKKKNQC